MGRVRECNRNAHNEWNSVGAGTGNAPGAPAVHPRCGSDCAGRSCQRDDQRLRVTVHAGHDGEHGLTAFRGPRAPYNEPAEPGSAGRTRRGTLRRRRGHLESAQGVHDGSVGGVRRCHEFGSGLHRQLRDPRQLQRDAGLGHLRPRGSHPGSGLRVSGLAERRVGLSEPAVRVGRGLGRATRLRYRRDLRRPSVTTASAASGSSTSPTFATRSTLPTSRPAAGRIRTPLWSTRTTSRTSTSTSRDRLPCVRRKSWRDARR